MLRRAYAARRRRPRSVQYVEAHGTGTAAGDPVEVGALGAVVGNGRPADRPCLVGSIKSNIGHTEGAAGAAGLVKVALALHHGRIPRLAARPARRTRRSRGTTLGDAPRHHGAAVAGRARAAPRRRAARSGSPARTPTPCWRRPRRRRHATPLDPRLHRSCSPSPPPTAPHSTSCPSGMRACWTAERRRPICAQRRRTGAPTIAHRRAVVGADAAELAAALRRRAGGSRPAAGRPKVVFVFPGQGSQWPGMARELLAAEPAFAASLADCDAAIRAEAGWSPLDVLTGPPTARLDEIDMVQPLLFAVEVALAALWRAWGIEPDAVVGHSMGEVAAAHVAGALDLADAVAVICRRSALLRRVAGQGAMAVVDLPVDAAHAALAGREHLLSVAVSNSHRSTVLSGDPAALADVLAELEAADVFCRPVKVDVASHSPQMDPLLGDLRAALAMIRPRPATIPFHSTVTAGALDGERLDAGYWCDNLRQPVRFGAVVEQLVGAGLDAFVEVSPHPILLPAVEQVIAAAGADVAAVASLRREADERAALLTGLGALYERGAMPRWPAVVGAPSGPVALPTYPWQRERFWYERPHRGRRRAGDHPLLGHAVASATEAGVVTFETALDLAQQPFLADHVVRGAVVAPAAAFVELIRAAAGVAWPGSACCVEGLEVRELLPLGDAPCAVQVTWRPGGERRARRRGARHGRGRRRRGVAAARLGRRQPRRERRSGRRVSRRRSGRGHRRRRRRARRGDAPARAALRPGVPHRRPPPRRPRRRNRHSPPRRRGRRAGRGAGDPPPRRGAAGAPRRAAGHSARRRDVRARRHRRLPPRRSRCERGMGHRDRDRRRRRRRSRARRRGDDRRRRGRARPPARRAPRPRRRRRRPRRARPRAGLGAGVAAGPRRDRTGGLARARRRPPRRGGRRPPRRDRPALPRRGGRRGRRGRAGRAPRHVRRDRRRPARRRRGPPRRRHPVRGATALEATATLVRAMATIDHPPGLRLWLVTEEAIAADGDVPVPNGTDVVVPPVGALRWGFGRTVATELPSLHPVLVDVGRGEAAALVEELLAAPGAVQVRRRGARRDGPRLRRAAGWRTTPATRTVTTDEVRLVAATPGSLDGLVLRAQPRRPPGPGEVEIRIAASGLNFIDVMKAMGVYPGLPADGGPVALGAGCAGTVVAVGDGVDGLARRRRGARDHLLVHPHQPARRLRHPARSVRGGAPGAARRGDRRQPPDRLRHRPLRARRAGPDPPRRPRPVHAATGGVGLAAVHLCRAAGAEVLATAGSEAKRDELRALGIEHVFDSRTTDFAAGVLAATGGRGVDVVLNSLAGAAIDAGLSVLAPGGRFVELGKRDVYGGTRLGLGALARQPGPVRRRPRRPHRPAIRSSCARLLHDRDGPRRGRRAAVAARHRGADHLRSRRVPHDGGGHPHRQARAHRRAGAGHRARCRPSTPDGTYLITGGLGALGLAIAARLRRRAAPRHLALLGAASRTATTAAAIDALVAGGRRGPGRARRRRATAPRLGAALDRCAPRCRRSRGVFHAAGALADATVAHDGRRRRCAPRWRRRWTGRGTSTSRPPPTRSTSSCCSRRSPACSASPGRRTTPPATRSSTRSPSPGAPPGCPR